MECGDRHRRQSKRRGAIDSMPSSKPNAVLKSSRAYDWDNKPRLRPDVGAANQGGRHEGLYGGCRLGGFAGGGYRRGGLRAARHLGQRRKLKLVDGKVEVQKSPPADTVTVIDMRVTPPKVLAELDVPNSVVGPPTNVAIAPKEDIALVSSNMMIDPADPTKQIPDDKVTVIDLTPLRPSIVGRLKSAVGVKGSPAAPTVLATVQAGKGPAGIAINKAGTLALVANRAEGTVSIFTIDGKTVTPAGKVTVGKPRSRAPAASSSRPTARARSSRAMATIASPCCRSTATRSRVEQARDRRRSASLRHRYRRQERRGGRRRQCRHGRRRCRHHQRHRPQARSAARGQYLHGGPDARGHQDCRPTASSSPSPS